MTTYICRACSIKHDIPRREDCPEVGICPICLEVHALYLVKREPATQASPWVLVEDELPEVSTPVIVAYRGVYGDAVSPRIGRLNRMGPWMGAQGKQILTPWMWCPIPPLPKEEE